MTAYMQSTLQDAGHQPAETDTKASVRRKQREQELRQILTENLGGTLEISTLQQRLLHSMTRGVALDGLHYHHEALDVDIRVGTQSSHSCGYRLLCTDEYLGEIVFKRNRKFTERELQLIEALIPALVNPLRNSLRSKKLEGSDTSAP
ncbi:hypothetical protein [Pseudohongiella sp.]|uniref:Uncharacterized protein n=1 Tax=marine sediment metagenome TaxID=412755 RepID=A0A0F9W071_9ZZZZ|nr:hypothetical protein [Pseudohongiella sp.]HDZ09904.1 hypothetical protein [Pseudohongiella sp.]HEA63650.1 hypothetical protein [Pseudohongiella sp.]